MGATKKLLNASVALGCLSLMACGGGGGGGTTTTATTTTLTPSIGSVGWNFDDDTMQGWTLAPTADTARWHISAVRSVSAPNSLRYADPATNNFDTGAQTTGTVYSPELTLGAAPSLSLDYFLDNECGEGANCDPDFFDALTVGVSTDGGQTFTQEAPLVMSALAFTTTTVNLAAYANQNVILDIKFDSGDAINNLGEGAYVDNIALADGVLAHTIRTTTTSVVTTEEGGTDTFDIFLNTAPSDDVTVAISSTDTTEALVMGGDSAVYTNTITVTFTTANWNVPQTVSVQGRNDYITDGDVVYNVVIAPAVSLDTLYSGVDAADITAVNTAFIGLAQCDGVTPLAGADDVSSEVPIGFTFTFQGVAYDTAFVGSNGFVTFGAGDTDFSESVTDLLTQEPRIAALWDDLDGRTGTITCANNTPTSMTVSYAGVSELAYGNSNSFDITLNSDGSIVIVYGAIAATDGLAGITPGLSIDVDPGETDLSANPAQSATGTTYELFSAADNDLSGTTLTFTPAP